jgi:hypothetical protein
MRGAGRSEVERAEAGRREDQKLVCGETVG